MDGGVTGSGTGGAAAAGPGLGGEGTGDGATAGVTASGATGAGIAGDSMVLAAESATAPLLIAARAGVAAGLASAFTAGLPPPNDSRNRRATGASTVDDADLTNSPCSPNRARTSLLVTPSSFANSCTRALPATASPVCEATAAVAPRLGLATTHCHRDFTVCS